MKFRQSSIYSSPKHAVLNHCRVLGKVRKVLCHCSQRSLFLTRSLRSSSTIRSQTASRKPVLTSINMAEPLLRRLIAGFSARRPGFTLRSAHMGSVVNNVALGQGFLTNCPYVTSCLLNTVDTTSRKGAHGVVATLNQFLDP
jgi:hypothetical protein